MHRAWKDMAAMAAAGALSIALLLAGCSSPGVGGATGGAAKPAAAPVKIGAILSLSGTYAGLGAPEKQAIELEVKRINEAGGIGGRSVEVLVEDDATDPSKAVAAATKLIEKDRVVALIGATGTGSTMAIRNEASRAGVPIVSMAGGSVITDTFDANTFQTPWPNRVVVAFTLKYLKAHGITKIALLSDSSGYGKDGHDVTVKQAAAAGVTIVADESFNPGDTDMTAQLIKIKAPAPQAVWLWNAGKEAATVAKNLRQIDPGAAIRLVGAPGNGRTEFLAGAGGAAEGFTFAAGRILLPETYGKDTGEYKLATSFAVRFRAAWGKSPDIFAGHAYDALAIVADAIKRAPAAGDDGARLRDAIEGTKGLVGIGGTFTYTPKDHNGLGEKDLVVYTVSNGTWELAK